MYLNDSTTSLFNPDNPTYASIAQDAYLVIYERNLERPGNTTNVSAFPLPPPNTLFSPISTDDDDSDASIRAHARAIDAFPMSEVEFGSGNCGDLGTSGSGTSGSGTSGSRTSGTWTGELADDDDCESESDWEDLTCVLLEDDGTAPSHLKERRKQTRTEEALAWQEERTAEELKFYRAEQRFRRASHPDVEGLLDHSLSWWRLPALDPVVLDSLNASPQLLEFVQALTCNPLTLNPDDWPDVLVECDGKGSDDDNSHARFYFRFCSAPDIPSAIEDVETYIRRFPADRHRSVPMLTHLKRLQQENPTHQIWHIYTGVTCAGLVSHRLEADEKQFGSTRYLNFCSTLDSSRKRRIFEVPCLRQKLSDDTRSLPASVVRIGANTMVNGFERLFTLLLGQLGWNSAVGGMEQGAYIPNDQLSSLISTVKLILN